MSTLQRRSLLLLLLFLRIAYAQAEDDCPAANAACSCIDDSSVICVDLGQSVEMPAFNPSFTVFSMLSFHGDTRILKLQSHAFAGIQFRTLDLSDLGLTSMDPAAFSGFNSSVLSELILANNSLRTLPATVFMGLTSLRVLDLRNNYITQLRASTFSDLRSSITLVFLSNNLIRNGGFPVGLLDRFDQLTRLEIEDNLLTIWSSMMLAGSTKITELSLAGNQITAFTKTTFDSLKQLLKLSLESNDIATLADETFRNLTSLRELDLSVNRLSNLNEHSLKGLDSLVTLNLSVNALSNLSVGAFLPLIRLQSLDLSHNLLRQLPDGLFAKKTTLTTLNLSGNNMTISNGTLRGLTSVTQLFLSGNSICAISGSLFGDLNKLRMLDLSDNKIVKMEAGLLSFSAVLQTINLSHNKLSEIPPNVFRNGPALARIDLSRNAIRRISQNTFYNLHLTFIDLSYNEIEFIEADAFYHIAELSTVLLNHNRFAAVPIELFTSHSLQNMNLDFNLIETLPATVFDWLYVANLSMVGNKIGTIDPKAFSNAWITKSINLAKNRIERISDNIFNYNDLKTVSHISLSHNSLTEVTSGVFSGLKGLTSVDLSNNRIRTVADGAFSILPILKNLRLDGNRLQSMEYNWIGSIETLRTLNLSSNELNDQALPAVRGLSGLTELYLDSNSFTSLELLPVMTSLNQLSVRNNRLSRIDYNGSASLRILNLGQNRLNGDTLASSLKSFHNLTSLKLSENRLEVIPSNSFVPFTSSLEELDLSGNRLDSTSLTAFSDLNKIRILAMDDNSLQDLSYLADKPVAKVLRILSLKRNKLNSTVFSVLSNYTKLTKLFLDGNQIDHIPGRVFQNMYNVKVLSLGRNILHTVSGDTFSGLQQTCQHLDLSDNRLSQVNAQALSSLKSLEHLDLSENNLTSITIPQIMPKLQVLNFSGNRLQRFPYGLRRFHGISTLNFSRNSLVSLPSVAIFGNPNDRTVVVDFHQNSLLNSGDLRLIGSFGHVDFSSNNFRDLIPTLLMRAKYIQQYDLSKNTFHVLSPIWQTAYIVHMLNMSGNNLVLSLHNPLATENEQCGTILTVLDLSYNSLRSFNPDQIASISSSLAVLDIRNNKFESLSQSEFNNLTKLTHLFLAGNPWICDCDLVWIRTLLQKDVYIDNAECIVPFNTNGQLIVCYTPPSDCPLDHPTNDTRCQSTTTSAPTSLSRSSVSTISVSSASSSTLLSFSTSNSSLAVSDLPVIHPEDISLESTGTTTPLSNQTVSTLVTMLPSYTDAFSTSSLRPITTPSTVLVANASVKSSTLNNSTMASAVSAEARTASSTPLSTRKINDSLALSDLPVTEPPSSLRPNISTIPADDVSIVASTVSIDASMSTSSGDTKTVSSTPSYSSTNIDSLASSDLPVIPPKDANTSLGPTHIVTTPLSNQTSSTPVTMVSLYMDTSSASSLRANTTTPPPTVPVADASIVSSTASTVSDEETTVTFTPSYVSTRNDSLTVSDIPVIRPKDTTSSVGFTVMTTTSLSNQTFSTTVTDPPSYTMSKVDASSLRPNTSTTSAVPMVDVSIVASTLSINASVSTVNGEAKTVSSTPSSNDSLAIPDFPVTPHIVSSSSVGSTQSTTLLSNHTFTTHVTVPPSYSDTFSTSSLRPNISSTPSTVPVDDSSTLNISITISTARAEATTVSSTPSNFSTSNVSDFLAISLQNTTSSLGYAAVPTTPSSNQTFSTSATESPSYTLSKVDTSSFPPNISTVPVTGVTIVESTQSINASVTAAVSDEATTSYFSTSNDSLVVRDLTVIPPKDTSSYATPLINQTFSTTATLPPPYSNALSTVDTSSFRPNVSTPSKVSLAGASTATSTQRSNASLTTAIGKTQTVSSTPLFSGTGNASLVVTDLIPPKDTTSSLEFTLTTTTPISNQTFITPEPPLHSYRSSKVDTAFTIANISERPTDTAATVVDIQPTSSFRQNVSAMITLPVVDVSFERSTLNISTTPPAVSTEATTVTYTPSYSSTRNDSLVVWDLTVVPPNDTISSVGSTGMTAAPLLNQTFSTTATLPLPYSDRLSTVDTSDLRPNVSTLSRVYNASIATSTQRSDASVTTAIGETQTVSSASLFSSTDNASFVVTDLPVIPPKDTTSSLGHTTMATTPLSNQTLSTPATMLPNISKPSTAPVADPSIVGSTLNVSTTKSFVSAEAATVTSTPSYSSTSNDSLAVSDIPVIPPKDTGSSVGSTRTATTLSSNETFSTAVTVPQFRQDTASKVDTSSTVANVSAKTTTSVTSIHASSTLSTAGAARTESDEPSAVVNVTLQPTSSTPRLHTFSTTAVLPVNATTAEPVVYPTGAKSTSTLTISAISVTDSPSTSHFTSNLLTRFRSSTASSTKTTVTVTSLESSTSTPVSNFTSTTPRPILTPGFRPSPRVTPGPPPPRTSPRLVSVITGAARVGENGDDRGSSSSWMDLSWTDKLLVAITLGVAAVLILLAAFIGLAVYLAGSA